jgi:hypothetical protein
VTYAFFFLLALLLLLIPSRSSATNPSLLSTNIID